MHTYIYIYIINLGKRTVTTIRAHRSDAVPFLNSETVEGLRDGHLHAEGEIRPKMHRFSPTEGDYGAIYVHLSKSEIWS